MSTIPVLLLLTSVGVSLSLHVGAHRNATVLQPIVSRSQTHRICAELCASGLGGDACGDACMDLAPQDFPVVTRQSASGRAHDGNARAAKTTAKSDRKNGRRDACPLLCSYGLGRPLCDCDDEENDDGDVVTMKTRKRRVDYVQVCGTFCVTYDYRIDGCQPCDVYRDAGDLFANDDDVDGARARRVRVRRTPIDWDQWCMQRCIEGDGGAACNCDVLPFRMPL